MRDVRTVLVPPATTAGVRLIAFQNHDGGSRTGIRIRPRNVPSRASRRNRNRHLKSTHGASQQEYPTDSARLVSVSICSRDQHIPKAYMWPSGRQLAAASFSDCTGGNLDGGQRLGARLARCGTNSLLRQPALRVGIPETTMPARTVPPEPSVRVRTLNLRHHRSSQLPSLWKKPHWRCDPHSESNYPQCLHSPLACRSDKYQTSS